MILDPGIIEGRKVKTNNKNYSLIILLIIRKEGGDDLNLIN